MQVPIYSGLDGPEKETGVAMSSELTEKNRAHWDLAAANYSAYSAKFAERMGREIVERLDWIGVGFLDPNDDDDERPAVDGNGSGGQRAHVRLLDYACGPGMVSQVFAPYISTARGIDVSPAMAAAYNTAARNQGLTAAEMAAAVGDLLDPADPAPLPFRGPDWFAFDLAAVGFGFHHFEDPVLAATRLAARLKTGGVLLIMDFLPHAPFGGGHRHGHGHGHGHGQSHTHGSGTEHDHDHNHNDESQAAATVRYFGFSEATVRQAFEAAGAGKDFSYREVAGGVVFMSPGRPARNVFFARGTKV